MKNRNEDNVEYTILQVFCLFFLKITVQFMGDDNHKIV
jgi:hypothetical protein